MTYYKVVFTSVSSASKSFKNIDNCRFYQHLKIFVFIEFIDVPMSSNKFKNYYVVPCFNILNFW